MRRPEIDEIAEAKARAKLAEKKRIEDEEKQKRLKEQEEAEEAERLRRIQEQAGKAFDSRANPSQLKNVDHCKSFTISYSFRIL